MHSGPLRESGPRSLCARCVAPHLRVLRAVGFCRRAGDGASRVLPRAYHALALVVTSAYVLQQFVYGYQERRDLDKLSQVMFLVLCHITCVVKQVVFHVRANRIDELVASLDEPLLNAEEGASGDGGALLAAAARGALRLLRVYAGCAVATCVLWIVFPVVYRVQGRHFEFHFWTGVEYDGVLAFGAILLYSFYATNLVAVGNTTMDAFICTILDLCRVQLKILRVNFTTLPARAAAAGARGERYEAALHRLFVDCLVHYKKITEVCTALQELFSVPLLVQFGVSGWILCMAAYNIVHLNVLSIEFASVILFTICILIEVFLYCYYGNEVTVESDRVSSSLYAMPWTRTPLAFRRALLVVMERARRPLRPRAGRVVPLSLDTFVTILKSSYSFYAVLRQTKDSTV